MPFSEEIRTKIIAKLGEKVREIKPCPVCGQANEFLLGEGLVNLEMNDNTMLMPRGIFAAGGPNVASHIALICTNCGNTQLLNIYVLEVASIIQAHQGPNVPPASMPPQKPI